MTLLWRHVSALTMGYLQVTRHKFEDQTVQYPQVYDL